jgi:hypothetical protein
MRELKATELSVVGGGEVMATGGDCYGDYWGGGGGGDSGGFSSYAYTDGDRTVDGDHGGGDMTLPTVTVTYNTSAQATFLTKMVDDCSAGNPVGCVMDLFQALRDAYSAAGR